MHDEMFGHLLAAMRFGADEASCVSCHQSSIQVRFLVSIFPGSARRDNCLVLSLTNFALFIHEMLRESSLPSYRKMHKISKTGQGK